MKAVIEDVQLRLEFLFGDSARFITAFPDNHRNAQPPRDQQGLITEVGGAAAGLNHPHAASFAAISTGKHIEANVTRLQQFAERDHERSLARTPHRQIANADHGFLEPSRRQDAAVEQSVS